MAATYLGMAVWLDTVQRSRWLFLGLYTLTFLFANAGPNSTTFILPTVLYPEDVRATCHGLSAAAGKVGAVLGSAAMEPLLNAYGLRAVLYLCGCLGLLGTVVTVLFIAPDPPAQYHAVPTDEPPVQGTSD